MDLKQTKNISVKILFVYLQQTIRFIVKIVVTEIIHIKEKQSK